MWEEKMTQEEEDLEEELNSLDIREDHGAEDSDVTPVNTPPITPPLLYIKKYPPIKPLLTDTIHSITRYSKEDIDSRSDSSLSWGDDEFEEEATKQVGILFDQIDYLLYRENSAVSTHDSGVSFRANASVTTPDSAEPILNNPIDLLLRNDKLLDSNDNTENVSLSETVHSDEGFEEINSSNVTKESHEYSVGDEVLEEIQSPQRVFYYGKFMESSIKFNLEHILASEPSTELQDECTNWVEQFPHFRVRGFSVDPQELKEQEDFMSTDQILPEDGSNIEVIACDGDYEHLLPLVSCPSANTKKLVTKDPSKEITSNSRVCSGSNDPEVLKEQVFSILFDKLWETVTVQIEPLLNQYARYIIEQSVQYSSLSREPSTRGVRLNTVRVSQRADEEGNANSSYLPSNISLRPFSGMGKSVDRLNRPISGIRRPCSASYRLQNTLVIPDIRQDELSELLQVSTKPLQNANNRMHALPSSASQTRESSAISSRSHLSLPAVLTPRDNSQRPGSSKTQVAHLTPRKLISYVGTEQRPSSTSSFHTRIRFQEKFQNLNRHCAILELGNEPVGNESEDRICELHEQPSPVWSRHIPFLPPIPDNAVMHVKPSGKTRENKTQSLLSVKGATIPSAHRSDTRTKSNKPHCGNHRVEPFLSWIMEKVENEVHKVGSDPNTVVKNSLVQDDSVNNCMAKTKQFRRYSHH